MTKTIFTKVDYELDYLVKLIELGEIALPDLQRPFVWGNAKVRDLLDSMYKGYPVGYLLFWQSEAGVKPIGVKNKQKAPRLLVVDGQQRLTSLYTIIQGEEIVRDNFKRERIKIAFNPINEKFEVYDAAIARDKSYIPDISSVWNRNTTLYSVIENYIKELEDDREINDTERHNIQKSIEKLSIIRQYPFTALELASDVAEEDIADVFVRINSEGKQLNQSDFILTLMSVFWEEGRDSLEKFCYESREQAKNQQSPFNFIIEPTPGQLLRVTIGLGFKRARLRHIYSILRGKDFDTGEFDSKLRNKSFDSLKSAQKRVLDLQNWHDFLQCVKIAGFKSSKIISSNISLLFAYTLFLIGRTEYHCNEYALRKVIARFFFMSSLTGRYTGSSESVMESDLRKVIDLNDSDQFLAELNRICEVSLTNDFWDITLPNELATSSSQSPSLYAYNASLVLLEAPALFSNIKIADLLDPTIQAKQTMIQRHHLFPKGYLESIGIAKQLDINQIANYAFVEYQDNSNISDSAPSEYTSPLKERFSDKELDSMYHFHSLPPNWENMEYNEFLISRRHMIANIIQEGYMNLTDKTTETISQPDIDLLAIVEDGESDTIEFKSTLRTNLHTKKPDKRMEYSVLKTISGFLNTNGGTLIIGVADNGTPVGIQEDGFQNEDEMNLYLTDIIRGRMTHGAMLNVHSHFEDYEDSRVLVVVCDKSMDPIYLQEDNREKLYVREGPSTSELTTSLIANYIKRRFNSPR